MTFRNVEQHYPGGSPYGFYTAFQDDFFQYVAIIRMGKEDHQLVFHDPYTEEFFAPMIIQPIYSFVGFLFQTTSISPFAIFFLMRGVGLFIFAFAMIWFLFTVTKSRIASFFSVFFFFTATATWNIINTGGQNYLNESETYTKYFSAFSRIVVLPPHHYLALAAFMVGLILLHKSNHVGIYQGIAAFLAVCIGLLHPYIALMLVYTAGLYTVIFCIVKRKIIIPVITTTISLFIGVASVLFYDWYMVTRVWGIVEPIFIRPTIPLWIYVQGVGLILFVAVIPFFKKKNYQTSAFWLLTIWALLPVVMFFLPMPLPESGGYRLFQVCQDIPFAILAGWGLAQIYHWRIFVGKIVSVVVLFGFLLYVLPVYSIQSREELVPGNLFEYRFSLVTLSPGIFNFLRQSTPPTSVVLAGSTLSNMIPAFTKNYVLVGHAGDTHNYDQKLKFTRKFFAGYMTPSEAFNFLKIYRISYIIYGEDATSFAESPFYHYNFLQEVYKENNISVVKVL